VSENFTLLEQVLESILLRLILLRFELHVLLAPKLLGKVPFLAFYLFELVTFFSGLFLSCFFDLLDRFLRKKEVCGFFMAFLTRFRFFHWVGLIEHLVFGIHSIS
jgi:hypothetical protein